MVRPSGNEGLILPVRHKLTVIPVTRVTGNSVCIEDEAFYQARQGRSDNEERREIEWPIIYWLYTHTSHTHLYYCISRKKKYHYKANRHT